MLPIVTAQQIREVMPGYIEGTKQAQRLAPLEPMFFPLQVRCGIADFILNSKEGTLEDRVYGLVAAMPLDVDEAEKQSARFNAAR